MVDYDRPLSLPVLVYSLWLLALIIIAYALYVFFYEEAFWDYGILQVLTSDMIRLITVLLYGLLIIISGIGIMKRSIRSRGVLLILCMIGSIHALLMILDGQMRGILTLLICIGVAAYMFAPRISTEFETIDSRKAVDAIDTLERYRERRIFE